MFRGTSNCWALTRHSANRACPTSMSPSATTIFLVITRLPAAGAADGAASASCRAIDPGGEVRPVIGGEITAPGA